jgi:hypothetical protein
MELAAMLSGERFSDRPASVCPVIGSLLRAYNDNLEDRRRQDLYRYAAEAVGTRGEFELQRRRGDVAIAWARERYAADRRFLRRTPAAPAIDGGPEEIAYYVMGSLGRRKLRRRGPGWWSDDAHRALLGLIDRMIDLGDVATEDFSVAGEVAVIDARSERLRDPVDGRDAFDGLNAIDALGRELVEQPA